MSPAIEVYARRFDSLEWPPAQRRIELPEPGILERGARFLRPPEDHVHRVTGVEIRDATAWNALWSSVAPGDSLRPPPPVVDFSRDMVYVVIAEQWGPWPLERIDIDRIVRIDARYSVYTTTWLAADRDRIGARMIDAIVVPTVEEGVTLFISGGEPAPRAPARSTRPRAADTAKTIGAEPGPRSPRRSPSSPNQRSAPTRCCARHR